MCFLLTHLAGIVAPETPGVPNEQELTRLYCALMKLPHPLTNMAFFKALSCFRMASIVQVDCLKHIMLFQLALGCVIILIQL